MSFFLDGRFYERRQRAKREPPVPSPSGWLVLLRWVAPSAVEGTGLCSYSVASVSDQQPLGKVSSAGPGTLGHRTIGKERIGDRLTVVDVAGHPEFTERVGQEEPGIDITFATLAVLLVWGEFGAAALTWRARRRRAYARARKDQAGSGLLGQAAQSSC